ncbi:OmpP1/FadL family transporter [Vogesella oryzae]|uniref:OmpP1/FadL family transporter n=1 Tax=Vogesella oryzae TaxID=1735285 RepID=UPI00158341EC|nr:OmpP1/FadL family transporter [Vogesella oryzae]
MQLKRLTLSVMMMGASAAAMASGYHFGTQSVSSQSTANASAAEAADASTIFYNAAGMTKLDGTNFSGAINLVMPSVEYSNASGNYPTGGAITTGDGGAGTTAATSGKITDDLIAVPHFYLSHQLNDKVYVGLGVYVPYASDTEYQRNSVLRYNLNATSLTTIDINPTVAFKLNEQHSVAVGVIAQYAKAHLRQYANFGFALAGNNPAGNGQADGFADVDGDDWGFGYNLAWMWDISDKTRVGINYRSQIEHTLSGTAKWSKPAAGYSALNAAGFKDSEGASVDITTPESLSLHGMHKLNDKVDLFADVTWTKHSRFSTAQLKYENSKTNQGNTTYLNPDWKDTYKIAIGGSYQWSNPLQLRFGIAYDKSPVPDDNHRLATMPDNDRYWYSFGAKYDINKNNSVDVAYSYIQIKDAKANVSGKCSNYGVSQCVSSQTTATADYKSHAQIIGVQYNHSF